MPNPIQGVNTANPVAPASTGQTGAAAGSGGAAATPPVAPAVDSADVGSMEALLQEISAAADQASPIDQDKVDALRQAIASGAYKVDPQEIARKMMQLDGLLSGSGGGQ